jgi:hypothetical protein
MRPPGSSRKAKRDFFSGVGVSVTVCFGPSLLRHRAIGWRLGRGSVGMFRRIDN